MAHTPPTHYTVFQGMACPECHIEQSHIQDVYMGTGINACGRSEEREGVKVLSLCEGGHAYIVGLGEHKGSAFIYVRLPLGGEVEWLVDYYDKPRSQAVRFTGKHNFGWHPSTRKTEEGSPFSYMSRYPLDNGFADLDSGVWA